MYIIRGKINLISGYEVTSTWSFLPFVHYMLNIGNSFILLHAISRLLFSLLLSHGKFEMNQLFTTNWLFIARKENFFILWKVFFSFFSFLISFALFFYISYIQYTSRDGKKIARLIFVDEGKDVTFFILSILLLLWFISTLLYFFRFLLFPFS